MDKHIVFVTGLACSGKSEYIKKNYPDYKVVDIYDFQDIASRSINRTLASYYQCAAGLLMTMQKYDKIILEHTLAKAKRRKMYIDIVKEIWQQEPDIVVLKPDFETYNRNQEERGLWPLSKESFEEIMSQFEMPTKDEGFNDVKMIEYKR